MRILGYFSKTKCFREQTSLGHTALTVPSIHILVALLQNLLLQPTLEFRKLSSVIIIITIIIVIDAMSKMRINL